MDRNAKLALVAQELRAQIIEDFKNPTLGAVVPPDYHVPWTLLRERAERILNIIEVADAD